MMFTYKVDAWDIEENENFAVLDLWLKSRFQTLVRVRHSISSFEIPEL